MTCNTLLIKENLNFYINSEEVRAGQSQKRPTGVDLYHHLHTHSPSHPLTPIGSAFVCVCLYVCVCVLGAEGLHICCEPVAVIKVLTEGGCVECASILWSTYATCSKHCWL